MIDVLQPYCLNNLNQLTNFLKIKLNNMPGKSDSNRNGSAGRGSSDRNSPSFENKATVSGQANQERERNTDEDLNLAQGRTNTPQHPKMGDWSFDTVLDKVPYSINVAPFKFNDEMRFYVRINGGDRHVFTWDSELGSLRAIDDSASVLPLGLEEQISQQLQKRRNG
jgi:hypothetical protein